ncbi:MAG: hypothetical protein GY943_08000 [Chloroflexi bacterium]|nr:hypothetical protein [Chloroflexota bacterium]
MDSKLESLWRSNSHPFDGNCLYLNDLVAIDRLRPFLRSILKILKPVVNDQQICKFADWHEHDGYVTSSENTSIRDLEKAMLSDDTFYASRHGDTFVRWAFYPTNLAFLLRYYILDKDEDHLYPGIWGTFDLIANSQILEAAKAIAENDIAITLRIRSAKAYFDQNYAE